MASTFVPISDTFYATINKYEGVVYVHLHHKHNKRKRLSLKYDDLKKMLNRASAFDKALDKLSCAEEEEDEDIGSSDDDLAYKMLTSDEPVGKRMKRNPHQSTSKQRDA